MMLFNAVSADALAPTGSRISAVCNFIFTWIDHAHFICGIPRNEYYFYMIPQYQPVHIYKKNVGTSRFPSRLVIRTNLPFPSLYFTKCFIFYV